MGRRQSSWVEIVTAPLWLPALLSWALIVFIAWWLLSLGRRR